MPAAHLTRLKTLLTDASQGRYGRDMAVIIRDTAKHSIGSSMPAKSLELQHTIRLIRELDAEIEEIEAAIQSIMDELHSPITTIPGISYRMGRYHPGRSRGTSLALILPTNYWHTLECPPLLRTCSAIPKPLKDKQMRQKNDIIAVRKIQQQGHKSLHIRRRSRCIRTPAS